MKRRNPWFVAVFSLITLGLYGLYWLIVTRAEMVKLGARIPSIFIILAPLLGLIGVVVLQTFVRFTVSAADSGDSSIITVVNFLSVLIGLVSFLGIIPASIYWLYKYSKGIELVTKKQTSFDFCFWWGVLAQIIGFYFIWSGVLQNRFNKQVTEFSS